MTTRYRSDSLYRNTRLNDLYLEEYVSPIDVNLTNVNVITLDEKYNNRPDLLAFDLYNNSKYWWVFVLYNRDIIVDPINDFKSGITIKVPKRIE